MTILILLNTKTPATEMSWESSCYDAKKNVNKSLVTNIYISIFSTFSITGAMS